MTIANLALEASHHPSISAVNDPLELRVPTGYLRVLSSDAPTAHGLTPSPALVDELHAHADVQLYLALRTATLKRPDRRLVTISTAEETASTPLGELRARALASRMVDRVGFRTEAVSGSLRMLDWSVPVDADIDARTVKKANPASWISEAALADQRASLSPAAGPLERGGRLGQLRARGRRRDHELSLLSALG